VYVGTDNGTATGADRPSRVFAFSDDSSPQGSLDVAGQGSHARGVSALAVLPDGAITIGDADTARIIVLDPALRTQRVRASLPQLRPCLLALPLPGCAPGVLPHAPLPTGIAVDNAGTMYIADQGQGTIWRLRAGDAGPQPWFQSLSWATGRGPTGIAWARDGGLEVTVGSALEATQPTGGGLYHLTVGPHGAAPSAATLVAPFGVFEVPGALAVGTSGTAYIVLNGPHTLVTVSPTGAIAPLATQPGAPLDSPSAVALEAGRLLVANAPADNNADRTAVIAIDVSDDPMRPA
jgi:hypothetical protein